MQDVCARQPHNGTLWTPYLYPRGLAARVGGCAPASTSLHASRPGCVRCQPPAELGESDRWLPVVHTRDKKHDTAGLWLYYARGCSDLAWNVGSTVLVRNRVHAAVELERRAHGGSEQAAVRRVAAWVRQHHPRWSALGRARHHLGAKNASVEFLLAEAARGIVATAGHRQKPAAACPGPQYVRGALQPCPCAPQRSEWMWRMLALTRLAGDPVLELFSVQLLRNLSLAHGAARPSRRMPDSLQLFQQPQGHGPGCKGCCASRPAPPPRPPTPDRSAALSQCPAFA